MHGGVEEEEVVVEVVGAVEGGEGAGDRALLILGREAVLNDGGMGDCTIGFRLVRRKVV
jgi:hypothetical protein